MNASIVARKTNSKTQSDFHIEAEGIRRVFGTVDYSEAIKNLPDNDRLSILERSRNIEDVSWGRRHALSRFRMEEITACRLQPQDSPLSLILYTIQDFLSITCFHKKMDGNIAQRSAETLADLLDQAQDMGHNASKVQELFINDDSVQNLVLSLPMNGQNSLRDRSLTESLFWIFREDGWVDTICCANTNFGYWETNFFCYPFLSSQIYRDTYQINSSYYSRLNALNRQGPALRGLQSLESRTAIERVLNYSWHNRHKL